VLAVFFIKNDSFRNIFHKNSSGLSVNSVKISDLVNQDTDGDTIPDWEEKLWGTNPNNKDTVGDGRGDLFEISRLQAQKKGSTDSTVPDDSSLTVTDRLSRELFSTVSALSQSGEIDSTTLDKVSVALAGEIQTSVQKVVYSVDQLKITTDLSKNSIKNYNNNMGSIYKNYDSTRSGVVDILQNSLNENSFDPAGLAKLDPIIKRTDAVISGMLNATVPETLKFEHLEVINALEQISENLKDVKLIDRDIMLALSAISQYGNNSDNLDSSMQRLKVALWAQLNK
jgi:hypothetical protein